MTKEIEEMNKAVKCLAVELPEPVWNDVNQRWQQLRKSLTPSGDVQERAKEFLQVLQDNWQAQIAGYYNDDKTDAERAKRQAVIDEYKDLIEIYKSGSWLTIQPDVKKLLSDIANDNSRDNVYQFDAADILKNSNLAGASSMQGEVDQLRAWKADAMKVMNDIDLQECGKVLCVPLGQSISDKILPTIKDLIADKERLRGYFEQIVTSPTPANERELVSWRETTIQLSNEALTK